jgi:hypothetical protein
MATKNKGGREIRKVKTSTKAKAKNVKPGTDSSKTERQDKLPHSK